MVREHDDYPKAINPTLFEKFIAHQLEVNIQKKSIEVLLKRKGISHYYWKQ
ncbi:MAG: hypothetical protein OXE77_00800 [Flavobacteriaceae bacterium]|nr:hypothetical protein [Flavobacteriaceae bacterium]MCY4268075.1 hypothetical protein [Flavobacteriaceae bacterium]